MPVLNLADQTLSLLGYLSNYGIETRDVSFFVNQPIHYSRRGRRGRRFCHPTAAAVVRVLFPIAATLHILSYLFYFLATAKHPDSYGVNQFRFLRSLSILVVFFQLSRKFPDLVKLARKFQQLSMDCDLKRALRFQNWPVWGVFVYYFVWFIGYYRSIFTLRGVPHGGNGMLGYFLSQFANLFFGFASFLPSVVCMLVYGVSGYVRVRIQNQLELLQNEKKSIPEKLNLIKTIVDVDYEVLRSLAMDADRIFGPIVGSIRFILIVQLYVLFQLWTSANIFVWVLTLEEVGFSLVNWMGYYLYVKSATRANKMIRQLPKVVCKMLVEIESSRFLEEAKTEKVEQNSAISTPMTQANTPLNQANTPLNQANTPLNQANTPLNHTEYVITVQNPVEQAIIVPPTYPVDPPPHPVYGTLTAALVNEDGALKSNEDFDATKILSLDLNLLACVTHMQLDKSWFHINSFQINGKEILLFWYQWNYLCLLTGRRGGFSNYVTYQYDDF